MQQFLDEIEGSVPALRRYARALTRDADRADDLVQDCIERAIRKRRLWSPTGPLRAWLFKILLNIYRNDARHRRRRGDQIPIDALSVEPAVAAPQPGRIALAEMARAVEALPAEQREALLLVVLEGLSYREVAEVQGVPIGTVMSRLARARMQIKAYLDGKRPSLRRVK